MPNDTQEIFAQIDETNRSFRKFVEEVKRPKPQPILYVKLLSDSAKVPTKGSDRAIGWDLYSSLIPKGAVVTDKYILPPKSILFMPTGIAVAIPEGYYGRIAPRSGLAARWGIDVLGGVVDSDYRGEVKVMLINTMGVDAELDLNLPIAQLILERADIPAIMVVSSLDTTERGASGFGSSDLKEAK